MNWSSGLRWAAFFCMASAIAADGFAKTDFHSVQAVLAASAAVFTGLGGLCLHPPWSARASEPVAPLATTGQPTSIEPGTAPTQ